MQQKSIANNTSTIKQWLRQYIIDLIILVMTWGGYYRCTLANADTLWGNISKSATLNARLENYRWMGFVGDGISYAMHYYPYENQKVSLGLFLVVTAAALLLTQKTFERVLNSRLVSDWDRIVYIAITSLCFVNVLISEMFYFTESYLIFKFSFLFAMLGCLLFSRGRYITGTIALFIAPMFYQVSAVHAALVLCTLAILEENGEFSLRLVKKELAYILIPMCSGLLNYVTGPYLLPIASKFIMHEDGNSVAKEMSTVSEMFSLKAFTRLIGELHDLYQSSLGLMIPAYLPLLVSLVITAAVIYSVYRRSNVLLAYLIYKVVAIALALVLHIIGGPGDLTPRTIYVFYVMQAMNAVLALYFVDHKTLRRVLQDMCVLYILAQVFFIQIIIANRSLSEYLDRSNATRILDRLEAYEEETATQVSYLSFCNDERTLNAYESVYYTRGVINARIYGETAFTLVETIAREQGRTFERVDIDPQIYEEYFAGHDWTDLDLDEQVVFDGDTMYVCVF